MLKKIASFVPALGVAVMPFLSQVTMSGASVALESSELASVGTALTAGGSSLLNVGIQLLPYIIALTVIMIVYGIIRRFGRLKRK